MQPENLAERLQRAAREGQQFGQAGWHRPYLVPKPEREPSHFYWGLLLLFVVTVTLTVFLLVIAGMRG